MGTKRYLLVFLLIFGLGGCSMSGPGRLYSNVTLPYTRDFKNTRMGTKSCVLRSHHLKEPVSGYGVSVEWSADRIQAAAEREGITRISCIDIQTISLVLGIYSRRKLIVYGD